MKKRAMKKWIPKDTVYCGDCKWRHYLGEIKHHKNPPNEKGWEQCQYANECKNECHTGGDTNCTSLVFKCDYLGMVDKEQDSLLWDGCKECGVHYPKD